MKSGLIGGIRINLLILRILIHPIRVYARKGLMYPGHNQTVYPRGCLLSSELKLTDFNTADLRLSATEI